MKKPKPFFQAPSTYPRIYEPSPAHKKDFMAGSPPVYRKHRADSFCPKDIDLQTAKLLLDKAIYSKAAYFPSQYPNSLYVKDSKGRYFQARLTQRENGTYHGHPCQASKIPDDLIKIL